MEIEGEWVSLRPARPDDAFHLLRWALHPEVAALAQGDYPITWQGTVRWLQQAARDRYRQFYIIVGPSGEPIGDLDLHHIAWRSGEAELRIRIGDPALWNQGLGTDAIRALLRHTQEQGHLRRIYLRVLKTNRRAIRCYEKCGFRARGRLSLHLPDGTQETVLLMSITLPGLGGRSTRGPQAVPAVREGPQRAGGGG